MKELILFAGFIINIMKIITLLGFTLNTGTHFFSLVFD